MSEQGFDVNAFMAQQIALKGMASGGSNGSGSGLGAPVDNIISGIQRYTGLKDFNLAEALSTPGIFGNQNTEGLLGKKHYMGVFGKLWQQLEAEGRITRELPDYFAGVQASQVDTNVQIGGNPFAGMSIEDATVIGPPPGTGSGGRGWELG